MKYSTHNDQSINTQDLRQQGIIHISYDKLVVILGEPNSGSGEEVDVAWDIEFDDGQVASIHNWKNGANYLAEKGLAPIDIFDWHIDGKSSEVVDMVKIILGLK